MADKRVPDPIDVYVGGRLKAERSAQGHSQSDLARALGITFQQMQKYEKGTNRVSASMMLKACRWLKVPVSRLFPEEAELPEVLGEARPVDRASRDLMHLYSGMSAKKRRLVLDLATDLAGQAES